MKANLDKDGIITISPDNETESYALKKWVDELIYNNNENIPSTLLIVSEIIPT